MQAQGGLAGLGTPGTCRSAAVAVPPSVDPTAAATALPFPLLTPQELSFIEALSPYHYRIKQGFVPHMNVPGVFYVNARLKDLLFEELQTYCQRGEHGGFLPAVKQIANVAALPGIVQVC